MALPYRQLDVWKRAYGLALEVARTFPDGGPVRYRRLVDQAVRAAFSVPANIAEGNGRSTPLDYAAFLDRARASLFELDTWLLAARDLGLLSAERHSPFERELDELSAMLFTLIRRIRSKPSLESR